MNQRGVALVSLLSLLPFLLAVMAWVGVVAVQQREYSHHLHICREKALEAQSALGKGMTELVKLNPKAEWLRKRRRIADEAARSGRGIPGVNVATEVYRLSIIAQQLQLRAQQRMILQTSKLKAQTALYELHPALPKAHVQLPTVKLSVYTTPPFTLSPNYEPLPRFEVQQAIKVSLDLKPSLRMECSATLHKENKKWIPKLGEGQSVAKSLSSWRWL